MRGIEWLPIPGSIFSIFGWIVNGCWGKEIKLGCGCCCWPLISNWALLLLMLMVELVGIADTEGMVDVILIIKILFYILCNISGYAPRGLNRHSRYVGSIFFLGCFLLEGWGNLFKHSYKPWTYNSFSVKENHICQAVSWSQATVRQISFYFYIRTNNFL